MSGSCSNQSNSTDNAEKIEIDTNTRSGNIPKANLLDKKRRCHALFCHVHVHTQIFITKCSSVRCPIQISYNTALKSSHAKRSYFQLCTIISGKHAENQCFRQDIGRRRPIMGLQSPEQPPGMFVMLGVMLAIRSGPAFLSVLRAPTVRHRHICSASFLHAPQSKSALDNLSPLSFLSFFPARP